MTDTKTFYVLGLTQKRQKHGKGRKRTRLGFICQTLGVYPNLWLQVVSQVTHLRIDQSVDRVKIHLAASSSREASNVRKRK